jgi:hypothetical protein
VFYLAEGSVMKLQPKYFTVSVCTSVTVRSHDGLVNEVTRLRAETTEDS